MFFYLFLAFLLLCVAGGVFLSVMMGYIPPLPSSFKTRRLIADVIENKKI